MLAIRAERRQDDRQLIETLDADFGSPERHARAVAGVEHPIREFAAKVRTLLRVDARQRLPTTKWRNLQRAPKQRMP
ncbi:hypothetical protein, partial [Mesorhizobium sp. M1295]